MKMDDLLIFTTLEKIKKTHRNVAVRTDAYAVQKNKMLFTVLTGRISNFFVLFLTFKFNFHNLKNFKRSTAVFKNLG